MRAPLFRLALASLAVAVPHVSIAQCPSWTTGFHEPGMDDAVASMTVFDDGSGPALYVGGDFSTAGPIAARHVARWDGSSWSALGEGVGNTVAALAGFDDGNGAQLYATGSFANAGGEHVFGVARWNGNAWLPLGGGLDLPGTSLAVFDDGSGPALYVGGVFNNAGAIPTKGVARWNGSSWSAVGAGSGLNVNALAIFDDGHGAALYAGGYAGFNGSELMKWDGASWTPIPAFLTGGWGINALVVHDDGSGAALYAGGDFAGIGGVTAHKIAKWNGTSWSALGSGLTGAAVETLASFDDGSGARLFVGGYFSKAGGQDATNIASWDGTNWSPVAGGTNNFQVGALQAFDAGGGSKLWVGGDFTRVGSLAVGRIAGWDGTAWSSAEPAGQGVTLDGLPSIEALAEIDDGNGPVLYAGGSFSHIGSAITGAAARWNGTSWSSLGTGPGSTVYAFAGYDDGSGPALFAGGIYAYANPVLFNGIAKWDGSAWSQVGGGLSGVALALTTFDDGSGLELFAGGSFTQAGGAPANNIAKWNGTSWSALGSGTNNFIQAHAVYDDGSGLALYVAGNFTTAGGVAANRVAKWDGTSWSALGDGFDNSVNALAVHDDGSGPALYAGGHFVHSGSTAINFVARWNGVSWTALSSGMDAYVKTLVSHDDGFGPALFAGGKFTTAGGVSATHVAKWDGSSWSPLAGGVGANPGFCHALAVFHDGSAPHGSLYAGGRFESASGVRSSCIARWTDACACSGTSYCTSGVTSSGCVPTISGAGRASASAISGFTISVANVEGQRQGHVFYGLSGPHAAPWGASSHFLCVKAPTQRTGTQNSGGTAGACDGAMALDWNAYVATHPGSLGAPFSTGASVWAQLYFRDPLGPKTTALSNALTFTVCP